MENEVKNNQSQDQTQNDQQQNNNKIEKAYSHAFDSMMGILGKKSFQKTKVKNSSIDTIVDEMLAEKEEKVTKEFKEKAQSIIEKKITFDKECREAEEAKNKLILEKKKAMTAEIKGLLQMVEDTETLRKQYVSTLNGIKEDLASEDESNEQSSSASSIPQ